MILNYIEKLRERIKSSGWSEEEVLRGRGEAVM